MLNVNADTGYEGKFDFPRRSELPGLAYMLASVPRTGSTWFSHLLWQSGCLGAPLEYLNYEPAGPYYFANASPNWQLGLWRSVLHRRTSPNGVFGIKCFPPQLQPLQESNPQLLSEVMATVLPATGPRRVVFFGRRDRAAHAISYARAIISGVWRNEQESGTTSEVEYSQIAVERALKLLEGQLAAWEMMFGELRIEPLRLWYEDALADPDAALLSVADYLGVALDPAAVITVPEIRRQSQADAAKWAERHVQADESS
jgi:trehalose 2-sulfotransferase